MEACNRQLILHLYKNTKKKMKIKKDNLSMLSIARTEIKEKNNAIPLLEKTCNYGSMLD